jgi:hypothetical protein
MFRDHPKKSNIISLFGLSSIWLNIIDASGNPRSHGNGLSKVLNASRL